jgi:hypothetical protein
MNYDPSIFNHSAGAVKSAYRREGADPHENRPQQVNRIPVDVVAYRFTERRREMPH